MQPEESSWTLAVAMHMEQQHLKQWKDMEPQEKKSIRNKFGSVKRAVKMVLMHADSYPLMPEDRSKHKALGFEDKTISMCKLEKALKDPNMKELERTLKLPTNTPEDARKFFKSD